MSILQEKLANGQFAITAEMAPPKGCDFTVINVFFDIVLKFS